MLAERRQTQLVRVEGALARRRAPEALCRSGSLPVADIMSFSFLSSALLSGVSPSEEWPHIPETWDS